jgi:hypothetical protein
MRKRVILLAVSCKQGGLCPGGLDLDDPSKWIRIVKDDGHAGAIQGVDIDFAKPLDIIEFEGNPRPQGKQVENWVINNGTCKNKGKGRLNNGNGTDKEILDWAYEKYCYNGFWGNYKAFLNEEEFNAVRAPSESIMRVSGAQIHKSQNGKCKIDFNWHEAKYKIKGVSMTDPDYYSKCPADIDNAYIVISIPKDIGDWINPQTGEKQAYKFVSKIYEI